MYKTLKQVLMERDKISSEKADQKIYKAKLKMNKYLSKGNYEKAEDICQECFGLEPDYMMELI